MQRQASRVWVLFLSKGLRAIGFKQSAIDECVFYRGSTIFLVYVDDGLFFAPTDEEIDKVIDELRDAGFNVTDEGDIDDYLGVKIVHRDNMILLTQPHLIQQLLEDTGLVGSKPTPTPSLVAAPLD